MPNQPTDTLDPGRPLPAGWDGRACAGLDVDDFFRQDGESDTSWRARETAALDTCRGCPVRTHCLADALALKDVDGVRGGTTGWKRTLMLRAQRRAQSDERGAA